MPLARQQLKSQGIPDSRLVFVDDARPATSLNGHKVFSYSEFLAYDAEARYAVLAVADSTMRESLASRCSADSVLPWSVTADNVVLMDDIMIGDGAVLSPFVTITSNIRIGRHFQANLYCYVEHDCVIGDFVTFAPGVKCNGNIHIEDHAYVGAGALIKQGHPGRPLVIGRGAIIGMGAVVTHDVPPGITVVGNPAKPLIKKG